MVSLQPSAVLISPGGSSNHIRTRRLVSRILFPADRLQTFFFVLAHDTVAGPYPAEPLNLSFFS